MLAFRSAVSDANIVRARFIPGGLVEGKVAWLRRLDYIVCDVEVGLKLRVVPFIICGSDRNKPGVVRAI